MVTDNMLILLGFLGLINASVLYWQYEKSQKTGKKMVCLLGENCGDVVGSRFGKTLGIKNELIGMIYYLWLIFAGIASLVFSSSFLHQIGIWTLTIAAVWLAGLFSAYLFAIQAFVLRKFCSWCLVTIFLNCIIAWLVLG